MIVQFPAWIGTGGQKFLFKTKRSGKIGQKQQYFKEIEMDISNNNTANIFDLLVIVLLFRSNTRQSVSKHTKQTKK